MQQPNNHKWVLITGAYGGLGKALVKVFVESAYKVIAVDLDFNKNDFVDYKDVISIQLDLESYVHDEKYANEFHNKVNIITNNIGIKVLINNAAIQILEHPEKISRQKWQQSFDINLNAPFYLIQSFLRDLRKNRGCIVNISSIHASLTKREFSAYATSKAALSALTRNLALDIGDQVRINAIEPAAIETKMLMEGFSNNPEKYQMLKKYHPSGRISTPLEIAKLALFLSTEDSGFIQGACIPATGGIHGCLSDPSD